MISALRFYQIYNGLYLHFKENSNYNFVKYNGVTKATEKSLMGRNDKYWFNKLALELINERDSTHFMIANFVSGKKYIKDFDKDTWLNWKAYYEALVYRYTEDLDKYTKNDPIEECFSGSKDAYNYLAITNFITDGAYLNILTEKYKDNILFEYSVKNFLFDKYYPLVVKYWNLEDNRKKLKTILKQTLNNK